MLGEIGQSQGRLGRDVLVTRVPGYLLRANPAQHDLRQYEQLVALGQKALAQGAPARASELLTKALGMWRGEPMSDIRHGPLLAPQVRRLEESRLVATELRIEAEMQLGRHHEVLSDLAVLVANNPMHEGFRAQHMLALFRAGRLSAALDSFHQFRHTLVSDLGLEPSTRLRDLHHAILAS
jgi:DNA-binding SARP family transcriptional activator